MARNCDFARLAASAMSLAVCKVWASSAALMRLRSNSQISSASTTLATAPRRATSCSLLTAIALVKLGNERAVTVQA